MVGRDANKESGYNRKTIFCLLGQTAGGGVFLLHFPPSLTHTSSFLSISLPRTSQGLPILPLIISTLMEKWNGSAHLSGDTGTSRKVVEYLDPDDLRSALNSDWRNHPHNPDSADLLALGETGLDTFGRDGCESLAALLRTIVGYSVDTSHPMFFNQLFGTLDPSAIAGELVSLFQNTR